MSLRRLRQCRRGFYAPEQIERIAAAQQKHNALATRITYAAGLRQHELLTLLPVDERPTDAGVSWSPNRFLGREGVHYSVADRYGMAHEVLIPRDLAAQLEARRLDAPVEKICHQLVWPCHYDVGGGQAWSFSFIAASRRVLRWSGGTEMLRASYEKQRVHELYMLGLSMREAREIVLQEVGLVGRKVRGRERAVLMPKKARRKRGESKLDRYRDEIEFMRYELHEALIDMRIYLWRKHRLSIREGTISYRLRHWKETEVSV